MVSLNSFLYISVFLLSISAFAHCYVEFHPEVQREWKQHKQIATWEEAKTNCQNEGAVLASPIDSWVINYMKSVIQIHNHTTPYYIGFKANHINGTKFVSQEGVQLEDIPDALDLVEKLDSRDGDCLCMDRERIRVVPCWTRLPYICYKNITEKEVTTTEVPPGPTDCNTGYKLNEFTTSYYKFYHDKYARTWEEANSTCANEGGYLAILNNNIEARQVGYKVFPLGASQWAFVYIGLRDQGENDWRSIHDEPVEVLYNVFHKNRGGSGKCGVLRFDIKLEKYSCYDKLPFVCEKRILTAC